MTQLKSFRQGRRIPVQPLSITNELANYIEDLTFLLKDLDTNTPNLPVNKEPFLLLPDTTPDRYDLAGASDITEVVEVLNTLFKKFRQSGIIR